MMDNINKLLEMILTSPDKIVLGDEESDILKEYGQDAPHYMLHKLTVDLKKRGYDIVVKKEDMSDFYIKVIPEHGDEYDMKISKLKVADGEISWEDFV